MKLKTYLLLFSLIFNIQAYSEDIDLSISEYSVTITNNEKRIIIKDQIIDLEEPIEQVLINTGIPILKDGMPGYRAIAFDDYNIYFNIDESLNMLDSYFVRLSERLKSITFDSIELNQSTTMEEVINLLNRRQINFTYNDWYKNGIEINNENKIILVFSDDDQTFQRIDVNFNITKHLDRIIKEEYDYEIKEDKLLPIYTSDYFYVNNQVELYKKVSECYTLYSEWLSEAFTIYKEFLKKDKEPKTPSEKYIFRRVRGITYHNMDIIRDYFSKTATKIVESNPEFTKVKFIQNNNENYMIKDIVIESVNWELGIEPYYEIFIYYDNMSSVKDNMKFNMIDLNGDILFKNLYETFEHDEGRKLFAGTMTDIKILYDLDYINFIKD